MWVCGLKQLSEVGKISIYVAPYVGVWIETGKSGSADLYNKSHPMWVCGLKHARTYGKTRA